MKPYFPSLRAALVLLVDAAAALTNHALDRLDTRITRWSNDLSGDSDDD